MASSLIVGSAQWHRDRRRGLLREKGGGAPSSGHLQGQHAYLASRSGLIQGQGAERSSGHLQGQHAYLASRSGLIQGQGADQSERHLQGQHAYRASRSGLIQGQGADQSERWKNKEGTERKSKYKLDPDEKDSVECEPFAAIPNVASEDEEVFG